MTDKQTMASKEQELSPQHKSESLQPAHWVDRYGNYLYRYALSRMRNPDEAENAVQETFLAALNAQQQFSGRSTEKTWLIGILKHKIIDQIRHSYREKPLSALEENAEAVNSFFDYAGHPKKHPTGWMPEPKQLLENKEFWQVLRTCLKKLPRLNNDAFLLREIEDLPSDLICKVLNITPANLWVVMHRTRLALRQCLEANWFEVPRGKK